MSIIWASASSTVPSTTHTSHSTKSSHIIIAISANITQSYWTIRFLCHFSIFVLSITLYITIHPLILGTHIFHSLLWNASKISVYICVKILSVTHQPTLVIWRTCYHTYYRTTVNIPTYPKSFHPSPHSPAFCPYTPITLSWCLFCDGHNFCHKCNIAGLEVYRAKWRGGYNEQLGLCVHNW